VISLNEALIKVDPMILHLSQEVRDPIEKAQPSANYRFPFIGSAYLIGCARLFANSSTARFSSTGSA
jgi:hypothetical protein